MSNHAHRYGTTPVASRSPTQHRDRAQEIPIPTDAARPAPSGAKENP